VVGNINSPQEVREIVAWQRYQHQRSMTIQEERKKERERKREREKEREKERDRERERKIYTVDNELHFSPCESFIMISLVYVNLTLQHSSRSTDLYLINSSNLYYVPEHSLLYLDQFRVHHGHSEQPHEPAEVPQVY
jgi:hypothetical protein